ncbi:MAG: ABC transporter ATP-binding protein [Candidatus Odinarchaeota archaeon]|nr:ABC transporter ATP-binding protein [Candidatus Odinarchaeota archaeon]
MSDDVLIKVENLKKYFPVRRFIFSKDYVKAVDGVTFEIKKGETFGVVGESGSGKTTLGRVILRLIEPTDGHVYFEGEDIFKLKGKKLLEFRRKAQMVFQDPFSSLDPRMTIFQIIMEGPITHGMKIDDPEEFVVSLLRKVGLERVHLHRYPHEFSGGQKQRIAIARALSLNPEFIVLDEPTSALDVSVQAQILEMLRDFQREFKFTYMFISHDLSVVKYMSDRIAVVYLGQIVEITSSDELFERPLHPYTRILLSALPIPDPEITRKKKIKEEIVGEPPSPINPPLGCRFHTRCPYAMPKCRYKEPHMVEYEPKHYVACWLYEKD